jgi:hypothetical protein
LDSAYLEKKKYFFFSIFLQFLSLRDNLSEEVLREETETEENRNRNRKRKKSSKRRRLIQIFFPQNKKVSATKKIV